MCRVMASVGSESGSGLFVMDWQVLFPQRAVFCHPNSWCIFISLTDLSRSLTHAPPPFQLQITAVICQPWSRSLAASHCVIDWLLHWWLAACPTTTRKPVQGHPLENAHPPPHHSFHRLLPSIHPYMHTYIHPSLNSPTPASHALALTSLINQGLSQSAVWAAVHFHHLLLPTLSTFLI